MRLVGRGVAFGLALGACQQALVAMGAPDAARAATLLAFAAAGVASGIYAASGR